MAKSMARVKSRRSKRQSQGLRTRMQLLWPIFKILSLSVLVLAGLLAMGYGTYRVLNKPLQDVQLQAGFKRVNTLAVEKVLADYKKERFLSIDLEQLQISLEAVEWVDRAEIRRRWPNSLYVSLTEHVAAARWGELGLLNTRGELILKESRYLPPELPRLDGPDGMEWQVAQQYLALREQVLKFGLHVVYLAMDARGAWRFELSSGMQVQIGREATDQRFYRFAHRVLPLLFELSQSVSVVDMRYSNGFAVQWQDSVELNINQSKISFKQQDLSIVSKVLSGDSQYV